MKYIEVIASLAVWHACHFWAGATISIYNRAQIKLDNSKKVVFSFTFNSSINSLSNLATKNRFWIARISRFQNCPWLLDLMKNWSSFIWSWLYIGSQDWKFKWQIQAIIEARCHFVTICVIVVFLSHRL